MESVRAADDVASAPPGRDRPAARHRRHLLRLQDRRGQGGDPARTSTTVASRRRSRARRSPRTMGIALSPCIIPAAGMPTFDHRRRTRWRSAWASTASRGSPAAKLQSADAVADDILARDPRRPHRSSGRRGRRARQRAGATPPEELYILYRRVHTALAARPSRPSRLRRRACDLAGDGRRIDLADPARSTSSPSISTLRSRRVRWRSCERRADAAGSRAARGDARSR